MACMWFIFLLPTENNVVGCRAAWDGKVSFKTHKGKTTREAHFKRQPDIANHIGYARPRTVRVMQFK